MNHGGNDDSGSVTANRSVFWRTARLPSAQFSAPPPPPPLHRLPDFNKDIQLIINGDLMTSSLRSTGRRRTLAPNGRTFVLTAECEQRRRRRRGGGGKTKKQNRRLAGEGLYLFFFFSTLGYALMLLFKCGPDIGPLQSLLSLP